MKNLAFFLGILFLSLATYTVDVSADTANVGSTSELTAALNNVNVTDITLKNNIDLGSSAFPVNRDITIDGQGHTINYYGSSASQGIYFNANNITIHYKNIIFGNPSLMGQHSSTNAGNYYGIAPASGRTNAKLIVEGVSYYSDYGAQPFYLVGTSNFIEFRGSNYFYMGGGSYSQEFAEASNFYFADNSSTTVVDNNTENIAFIWPYSNALNFELGQNALVNITTAHDFLYVDVNTTSDQKITVGDGSSLTINQSNTTAPSAAGQLSYFSTRKIALSVGNSANLAIRMKNPSSFTSFVANLGQYSTTSLSTGGATFFTSANNGVNITLDNVDKFSVKSEVGGGTTTGPLGSNTTAQTLNTTSPFIGNSIGYDVQATYGTGSPTTIFQDYPGIWSWSSTLGVQLKNVAGQVDSRTTPLKNAKQIDWVRAVDSPTVLSWSPDSLTTEQSLSQYNYLIPDTGMPVNYYWQDEDNRSSLVFKLFDSNHNLISTDSGIASDGTSNFYQRSITIPKTNLSVGVHKFTIESYRKKSDGSVTTVPMSTLTLTVTVEEYLGLSIVPSNLSWTNRTSSQSKGLLNRDDGNSMTVTAIDSRSDKTTPWKVVATVQNTGTTPTLSLKWRSTTSSDATDLEGVSVLSSGDATTNNYYYTKTWNNNVGVLLGSANYLPVGDYSNQLTVTWTLNLVSNPG